MLGLHVDLHWCDRFLAYFFGDSVLQNVSGIPLKSYLSSVRCSQIHSRSEPDPELIGAGSGASDTDVQGLADGEVAFLNYAGLRSFPFTIPVRVTGRRWIQIVLTLGDVNIGVRVEVVSDYLKSQMLLPVVVLVRNLVLVVGDGAWSLLYVLVESMLWDLCVLLCISLMQKWAQNGSHEGQHHLVLHFIFLKKFIIEQIWLNWIWFLKVSENSRARLKFKEGSLRIQDMNEPATKTWINSKINK